MRAAVCYEFGKPLVIEEVTIEPPGPGEVKVKIKAAGICHSDLHFLSGEHGNPDLPLVGGHEVAGIVEEVGENVKYVKPGDHVIVCMVATGCGECHNCIHGNPHKCEVYGVKSTSKVPGEFLLSGKGHLYNKDGIQLSQHSDFFAGFSEYTIVDEHNLVKMDDDIPFELGAIISCAVISGVYAVVNRAKVKFGESVVVIGTGGVGLNAVQGAALSGAYPIIAVNRSQGKLDIAKAYGATHLINTSIVEDPVAEVRKITKGRGADYVFVTVAGTDVKKMGHSMSNNMTVFIGHSKKEPMSYLDTTDVMGGIITGSAMGNIRAREDIPLLIDLYRIGRLKLDELITNRYPFEEINEALASSARGEAIRNVILFD